MIKELNCIQSIHCQKCNENGTKPQRDYFYPYSNRDRHKWLRNFSMAEGCRLLQLYSDRILAVGADSFVLDSDKGSYVFKLYPERNFEEILYYQKETNRLSEELKTEKIMVGAQLFKINVCKIENVIKLPKGCVIANQKFVSGLHEYDRLSEEYRKDPHCNPFSYLGNVNKFINKHYESIAISNGVRSSDLYIFSENFKVNENNKTIYITDLACTIGRWIQDVSIIRAETL